MKTPRELGLRWPAEWEPHRATWLAWPHNHSTWPGHLKGAEQAFTRMVRALQGAEEVCISVQDEAHADRVAGLLAEAGHSGGVSLHVIPTNDAWVRDHGPVFLTDADGGVHAADFRFDAWGKKYPPWDLDDAVPSRIAELREMPCHRAGFVLEGGSIEGNGAGTVLTTASCLLNGNRRLPGEPPRSIEAMQERLREWLGAECVLWLGDGIVGDDTDGHVDDIVRFVSELVVVATVEPDPADPNHAPLAENLDRLQRMRDARGRPLDVVPLPMPPPIYVDGLRCPASYANFYLANGVALVPVFGVPSDERALAVLREVLPDRRLAPIPARDLVLGLGACHCLTQQEPAGS
ncbi:MAG: agmatine deiminase family protein [Deltaproteobacteria bacterium]|nr:agmatine deiminase family protein [Deltaproteobacteria bacterium]MBW2394599.1 agmatine deiminase family protein [Deltaproteobacteria bacterium]